MLSSQTSACSITLVCFPQLQLLLSKLSNILQIISFHSILLLPYLLFSSFIQLPKQIPPEWRFGHNERLFIFTFYDAVYHLNALNVLCNRNSFWTSPVRPSSISTNYSILLVKMAVFLLKGAKNLMLSFFCRSWNRIRLAIVDLFPTT